MSSPAETYEEFMVPVLFQPWVMRLLDAAKPQPGERVLDVACGTGVVARAVRPLVGPSSSVCGIDLSPDMLDVARKTASREGIPIEWKQGRAEELPFESETFDLALCQFALMFFADSQTSLTEMRRVLASSGRIALSVFQSIELHPFYQALDEAIARRLGTSGVRDIFSLGDTDLLMSMMVEAEYVDVTIDSQSQTAVFRNPEGFLAGEIDVDTAAIPAMGNLEASTREELIRDLKVDMEAPLREVTRNGQVELSFRVFIVAARKGC